VGVRGRRRHWGWAVVAGVSVVLVLAGYLTVRFIRSTASDECTARGTDGTTATLDPDQASHAATIAAVAHARGLPERAVTIALATAIQESKLRNLTYGDRDSLGLFQQRPSQGWGTSAQILDPVHAAGTFFDALVKVPDYLGLPVTVAAQRVQHSGYPQAYARHEGMAATLAGALSGREGPALTCTVGDTATTKATDDVAAAVEREFGGTPAPRTTPDGGLTYSIPAGRTSTGWSLALWLVCHATELHVTSVTFDGRRWSSADSGQGWTHTAPDAGGTGTLTVTR